MTNKHDPDPEAFLAAKQEMVKAVAAAREAGRILDEGGWRATSDDWRMAYGPMATWTTPNGRVDQITTQLYDGDDDG